MPVSPQQLSFSGMDKQSPYHHPTKQARKQEQNPPRYIQVLGNIPCDIEKGSWLSIERTTPLKIYSLGFQPAKSIPEIPRWFLQTYAPLPCTILDPFAGSGTTILESLQGGATAYWLDYHPLSQLLCRVKTTIFSLSEVQQEATSILHVAYHQKKAPETIQFTNKDFWFQKPVQEALEILRMSINESKEAIQPVLWLAFASTVRKTSNMNDGMLLAARRTHIEKIPQYSRCDVFHIFRVYVDKAIHALDEWYRVLGTPLTHVQELPFPDARVLQGSWMCDAIVTSPPYVNAIDYVWASKFELHWLGMVQNDKDRLALYTKEVGTERLSKQECDEIGRTGYADLDDMIENIYKGQNYQATKGQNKLRARVVYQYFIDMKQHFISSLAHLHPGGYYCFSIGETSRICGVEIPVATLLTRIAWDIGFQKRFHFHILLKNRKLNIPRNVAWAGTIKHDTVVVLQRPYA